MATLNNRVFDNGLSVLDTEANKILLTSQEATDYTGANVTFALGNSTSLSVAAPSDRTGGGREVVVAAISDGSVTATGTATHYAIVYSRIIKFGVRIKITTIITSFFGVG